MQIRHGRYRSPAEDFAADRRADEQFAEMLRAAVRKGREVIREEVIVEPDIILWRTAGFDIHPIDNGPDRERFTAQKNDNRAELEDAVAITVAMAHEQNDLGFWQPPHKRKRARLGRYTLFDLNDTTCRFPTDYNGQHLFCGRESWGHSYCACHAATATRKVRR